MPYTQVTKAQLRALVKERLGALASDFYRDAELDAYVQEALRVWNAATGYWRKRVVLNPTVVDEHWYAIPGTITSSLHVTFNLKPVGYTSTYDLDCGQPNWEMEHTASGGNVPDVVSMWAPAGVSLIAIWPADHVGGNSLAIDGVATTPVLGGEASYVDVGSEELNHLLDYVEHVATFKQGGAEFEATRPLLEGFIRGAAYRNSYLAANARFKQFLGMDKSEESKRRYVSPERVGMR